MTDPEVKMLHELFELDSGLTDWEVQFIESLGKKDEKSFPLSDRQNEVLRQIHTKRCVEKQRAYHEDDEEEGD